QMTAAAVSTMDDMYGNRSGLYGEFIDKVKTRYAEKGKSLGTCYWSPMRLVFRSAPHALLPNPPWERSRHWGADRNEPPDPDNDRNCLPVRAESSSATSLPKSGCAFRPVPTAVPPMAKSLKYSTLDAI
uniref:hypothetical protein n=1 Tax=Acetomicrobium sp. S15 = DSM 107314 TaxID=2529858 RepID=UPI00406C9B6D